MKDDHREGPWVVYPSVSWTLSEGFLGGGGEANPLSTLGVSPLLSLHLPPLQGREPPEPSARRLAGCV